jgi:hypothetical protein
MQPSQSWTEEAVLYKRNTASSHLENLTYIKIRSDENSTNSIEFQVKLIILIRTIPEKIRIMKTKSAVDSITWLRTSGRVKRRIDRHSNN